MTRRGKYFHVVGVDTSDGLDRNIDVSVLADRLQFGRRRMQAAAEAVCDPVQVWTRLVLM